MGDRGTGRDETLDEFIVAQDGDYEPAPHAYDADDLPVDAADEVDELVPDDDRAVTLDDVD